jgi:hypothetical protein
MVRSSTTSINNLARSDASTHFDNTAVKCIRRRHRLELAHGRGGDFKVNKAPYLALVEAAASLTDAQSMADLDEGDVSVVAAYLRQNQGALESARRALGPQCVVPLRFEDSFYSEHCGQLRDLRRLAVAWRAEAHRAAHNADYGALAKCGLDILELANAIRRGGLVTDFLVGIAISGIGIETLRNHRAHFDSAIRHRLMYELRRLEDQREALANIVARDHEWEVAMGYGDRPDCDFSSVELQDPQECGLSEEAQKQLRQVVQQLAELPKADQENLYLDQDRRTLALMRMLMLDLAIRDRYESKGSLVEHLSELEPALLPKVPLDPFTNSFFVYRRTGDALFHLYSTGPKMCDGGGQIGPWPLVSGGCADLYLDGDDDSPQGCTPPDGGAWPSGLTR